MESDALPDGTDRPEKIVTVNQIVAWNLAWYRRQAGLTQEQVGEYLGWPKNKVSEAERSWDGKRTRKFDAQLLTELGIILGIPVMAFFLPPEDDSEDLYFIAPGGERRDMTDLLWLAMHDNGDRDSGAMRGFRFRFLNVAQRLLEPQWAAEVARWLERFTDASFIADQAAIWRSEAASLRRSAERADLLADELQKTAKQATG
jgi:hypothetical protein